MSNIRVVSWVAALVGVSVLAVSCSQPTSLDLKWATGYAELPAACTDLGESVDGAVREFMGALPGRDRDMRTRRDSGESLWCSLTAEDPVPTGDRMPSSGAMSRTATVALTLNTFPRLEGSSSSPKTSSLRELTTPTSGVSAPVMLPGVGDDAVIWLEQRTSNTVKAEARAVVANIHIRVTTSGYDWAPGFPSGDTAQLRGDLRAGAESIIAVVARAIPARLPTTVLEERPQELSVAPTETSNPSAPVWDPCTLSNALAEFGLTRGGGDNMSSTDSKSCYWKASWYNLTVESTGEWFARRFYDEDRYAAPTPVVVGGRPALRLYWAQDSGDYFCDLAFDVPQGERDGAVVGTVLIEVNTGVKSGLREEACAQLTKIADAVAGQLPPGR
ncbi:DUF3558 family protein [Nocardia neocaledoniensis]|uniref:DUF3558 family protein n=1 Tax=Nocardia neocaledoniensis TaxID=236511 RepID=UPI0033C4C195